MSKCSCAIDVDASELPKFHRAVKRTARGSHTCCECRRKIEKGEPYENVVGRWNGKMETFKTCSDCLAVRDLFFCGGYNYCAMWEDVRSHIVDTDGQVLCDEVATLPPRAKARILEMVEETWGDRPVEVGK